MRTVSVVPLSLLVHYHSFTTAAACSHSRRGSRACDTAVPLVLPLPHALDAPPRDTTLGNFTIYGDVTEKIYLLRKKENYE